MDFTLRRHTGSVKISAFDDARLFAKKRLMNVFGELTPNDVVNTLELAIVQPKNAAHQMKVFRKYVPVLIDMYDVVQQVLSATCEANEELQGSLSARSRKRYTPEEDEAIVEMAASGHTTVEIALGVGRTPGAVQTRISHLVGIGKISEEIAGRFSGLLDGEFVEGDISGTIYKKERK